MEKSCYSREHKRAYLKTTTWKSYIISANIGEHSFNMHQKNPKNNPLNKKISVKNLAKPKKRNNFASTNGIPVESSDKSTSKR